MVCSCRLEIAGCERSKGEKNGDHERNQEAAGAEREPRKEAEASQDRLRQGVSSTNVSDSVTFKTRFGDNYPEHSPRVDNFFESMA